MNLETQDESLKHHGILGQKWYETNGPPYPLTNARRSSAERRLNRKDMKFVKKVDKKVRSQAYNASKNELEEYEKTVLQKKYSMMTSRGKLNANYVNAYNKKMADLMNQKIGDIEAPSGRVIRFIAKRKNIGVYTALADPAYNMEFVKNGVYLTGKVAYKKADIDIANYT